MMKYNEITINDLLQDESFHEYVKNSKSEVGKEWTKRIENHATLKKTAANAAQLLRSINFNDLSFSTSEVSEVWNRINNSTTDIPAIPLENREGRKIGIREYLKIAAVLVPLIVLSVVMYFQQGQELQIDTVSTIVKECPNGRKMLVTFPDGSRAKLNAGSKISYKSQFDNDLRIVELDGEGFFEVQKDVNRPFIVRTNDIQTQVLGTSFNVSAYPDESEINVVVRTGLVSVSFSKDSKKGSNRSKASSVLLNPSEMATYTRGNKKLIKDIDVNVEEMIAWNSGVLIFKNASTEEIVNRLERWYGVQFEFVSENKMIDGFSGRFENESLRYVLDGMSYASHFEYEIIKNVVKIK